MTDIQNVNTRNRGMDTSLCNTPVANSLRNANSALYDNHMNYNVPYNTPAPAPVIPKKLSLDMEHLSPLDPRQQPQICLESVLNDIYAKLKNVDVIPSILENLQALPSIDRRLGAIEGRFSKIESDLSGR